MSHTDHQSIGLFNPVCQTDTGTVKVLTRQAKRPKPNHNKGPAVKVIHKNNRIMFLFSLYSE